MASKFVPFDGAELPGNRPLKDEERVAFEKVLEGLPEAVVGVETVLKRLLTAEPGSDLVKVLEVARDVMHVMHLSFEGLCGGLHLILQERVQDLGTLNSGVPKGKVPSATRAVGRARYEMTKARDILAMREGSDGAGQRGDSGLVTESQPVPAMGGCWDECE